jgi:23S rRNA (pseudouridine1915-N3)-methyltransferase
MNLTILCAGKLKEKYWNEAICEYSKRLSRFVKLTILEIPDEKIPDNASQKQEEQVKEKEGAAILSKIAPTSFVVSLCVEGKQLSSEMLSEKIEEVMLTKSHITFLIGGSLGLSNAVKERSDLRLSFSKMTFPHQLMRVVLLEQIYRAFKIIHHETYHK